MSTRVPVTSLDTVQQSILQALAYFDVFAHPLTREEIIRFSDREGVRADKVGVALQDLVAQGMVRKHGAYHGLGDLPTKVAQRMNKEARAKERMPKAERMSRLIAGFPFVRGVFLSGSISKGCLAEDGDIDFFIITSPGRLWVARTLLVLYKKIFLLNDRRNFCVNYFIDTEHLAIEDRNRFTATELVTLIPTYGNGLAERFFDANRWAFDRFPHAHARPSLEVRSGDSRVKRTLERWLSGRPGTWLDGWAMQLTWYRWKQKFSDLDPRSFEIALRTRTYVSKHHPRNFQRRVLEAFEARRKDLEVQARARMN